MSETVTVTDPSKWDSTIWDPLTQAVHGETERTKIAQKILPLHMPPDRGTVPADTIKNEAPLEIAEEEIRAIITATVGFAMTSQQVAETQPSSIAMTLTTRAANLIAIAEDSIVFQGSKVKLPKFINAPIPSKDVDSLLGENGKKVKSIAVDPIKGAGVAPGARSKYGENTFASVAKGIAELQGDGHYGPYALVLHSDMYADTHAPLEHTLIMPADRIRPLVEKGFYGTGTLPQNRGVLLSLGGNTMDLTVTHDAKPEFLSYARSENGNRGAMYSFQVRERFALRLKDKSAVRRLEFQ